MTAGVSCQGQPQDGVVGHRQGRTGAQCSHLSTAPRTGVAINSRHRKRRFSGHALRRLIVVTRTERYAAGVLPAGYEIRALSQVDAPALAAAYRRNRDHLAPWEPTRDEAFYTDDGQAAAVEATLEAAAAGTQDAWLIMRAPTSLAGLPFPTSCAGSSRARVSVTGPTSSTLVVGWRRRRSNSQPSGRRTGPAPGGGRDACAQRGLPAGPSQVRLRTRRPCTPLPLHRRSVARPRNLSTGPPRPPSVSAGDSGVAAVRASLWAK